MGGRIAARRNAARAAFGAGHRPEGSVDARWATLLTRASGLRAHRKVHMASQAARTTTPAASWEERMTAVRARTAGHRRTRG